MLKGNLICAIEENNYKTNEYKSCELQTSKIIMKNDS